MCEDMQKAHIFATGGFACSPRNNLAGERTVVATSVTTHKSRNPTSAPLICESSSLLQIIAHVDCFQTDVVTGKTCAYRSEASSLLGFRRGPCSQKHSSKFVLPQNPPQFPECKKGNENTKNNDAAGEQVIETDLVERTSDVFPMQKPLYQFFNNMKANTSKPNIRLYRQMNKSMPWFRASCRGVRLLL